MLRRSISFSRRNVSEWHGTRTDLSFDLDGENKKWVDYAREEKIEFLVYLLEQCELVDRARRCQAMRAILYLIQGVFYQCTDVDEYMSNAKENVLLLHACDGVQIFIDLFNMELNQWVIDRALWMKVIRRLL